MNIIEKIKRPESRKFEVKRILPSKAQWLKTIISFANGAGGELILGIDDKTRVIVGVENLFELEERITNIIHDSIRPFISPYIQSINLESKQILSVQILPGTQKPYYLVSKGIEKGAYIRIGSSNRQADLFAVEELKRQALGVFYLGQIYFQGSLDSLDKGILNSFFTKSLDIQKPSFDHFFHYGVIEKNNGDVFPAFLGMILFGREDRHELNEFYYSHIKVTKYKGTDQREILFTQLYEPPLALKIDKIIDYTLSMLPNVQKLEGAKRKRIPLLPEFAMREAIINAIVHRDYSLLGASIQVDIFDDRCEVKSPGVLPGTLSIELLGQGISEIRNRNLARILRCAGFVEELGSGIRRMIQEMENFGNPKPEFMEKGAFFCVTLRIESPISTHLQGIYQLLKSKAQLSSSEISKELNVHQNTAINRLQELIKLGIVKKAGSGKNIKYNLENQVADQI